MSKAMCCSLCGYAYDPQAGDPSAGINPGTPFDALPDDWRCPRCGAEKRDFVPLPAVPAAAPAGGR